MKRLLFFALLLMSLTACGGSSAPGEWRCDKSNETGELCIKLTAEEPITLGAPVTITIAVSSEKDIPGLKIFLFSDSPQKVFIEEPSLQGWSGKGVNWPVDAQANQPLTFKRKVRLPAEEGSYQLIVHAAYAPLGMVIIDSLDIYLTREGGKVYYSGTHIPFTEGPLPTITPGPSSTPLPTP